MTSSIDTQRVWHCGEYDLPLTRPLVMGVLNVTPDSFSDGGDHDDPARAVARGERMIAEGAAIIDLGGESTRPGAPELAEYEELARVRPVVSRLIAEDVPVSIDTRHASVAQACVESGAAIINDIAGFRDPAMVEVAAGCDAGLVVMHMLGTPETMQQAPRYEDVVREVGGFLLAQAAVLEAAGVARERIMLDPGIGFGKTLEHNIALLAGIPVLVEFGYPVLIGVSRKRFIGELSDESEPRQRLGGSIAAGLSAVRAGASVLRVHDVGSTVQALSVMQAIEAGG
jgi:dihydropteroate synthase